MLRLPPSHRGDNAWLSTMRTSPPSISYQDTYRVRRQDREFAPILRDAPPCVQVAGCKTTPRPRLPRALNQALAEVPFKREGILGRGGHAWSAAPGGVAHAVPFPLTQPTALVLQQ